MERGFTIIMSNGGQVASPDMEKRSRQPGGKQNRSIKVDAPKTKAGSRTIPLTLEIKRVLIKHKEVQTVERFKAGSAWQNNNLVFCTAFGGYLSYRNVTRLYNWQIGNGQAFPNWLFTVCGIHSPQMPYLLEWIIITCPELWVKPVFLSLLTPIRTLCQTSQRLKWREWKAFYCLMKFLWYQYLCQLIF